MTLTNDWEYSITFSVYFEVLKSDRKDVLYFAKAIESVSECRFHHTSSWTKIFPAWHELYNKSSCPNSFQVRSSTGRGDCSPTSCHTWINTAAVANKTDTDHEMFSCLGLCDLFFHFFHLTLFCPSSSSTCPSTNRMANRTRTWSTVFNIVNLLHCLPSFSMLEDSAQGPIIESEFFFGGR